VLDLAFLLVSGIVIGIIVAAPVGPVNLICIRRTLAFGPVNGFVSGTGAALGDGVFAAIVAFGLTAISGIISDYEVPILLIGAAILLFMSAHTWRSDPRNFVNPEQDPDKSEPITEKSAGNLARAITSTFFLTVTNPATLFGFVALFAGVGKGISPESNYVAAAILVGAVVAGSALWWLVLCAFTGLFHGKMTVGRIQLVNRVSSAMIGVFAVVVLIKAALAILSPEAAAQ